MIENSLDSWRSWFYYDDREAAGGPGAKWIHSEKTMVGVKAGPSLQFEFFSLAKIYGHED